jgi:predicted nucleotidyltransferase
VRELPVEVSRVLESLLPAVLHALGGRVVSIVLWGSSVLGEYRVGRSDIDLLVGLDADPDAAILGRLQAVHVELDRSLPEWRGRVEVAYVGVPSLQSFRTIPHVIARISPGEPLNLRTADSRWLIDWFRATTAGVTLYGRAAPEVIPTIRADELRAESARQLGWRATRPPDDASDALLAYIVLLACRALYAIDLGRQPSKSNAGRWLAQSYPNWAPLAEASVRVNESNEAPRDRRIWPNDVERFTIWAARHGQERIGLLGRS